MYGCDAFACLELHHDAVVDEKIESCFADSFLLVLHGNRCLAGESDAAECQLNTQRFFVDGFQKARAEMPMHFDRRADHSMHKDVERCARFLSPYFPGSWRLWRFGGSLPLRLGGSPCPIDATGR